MAAQVLAALITGGGRGIGRAQSIRLAQKQPVMLVGRTESALRETADVIRASGNVAEYVAGDVTDQQTASRIQEACESLGWNISSLVLNAGRGKSDPTDTFPLPLFREIFDLNLFSTLPLIQLVLPGMMERREGTIVFLCSTGGLKGLSHDAAYSASKHGQIGLARSLALEFGKYRISVVPICPGLVESEMTDRVIAGVARRRSLSIPEARALIESRIPQRRIIPAEEVAEVVAFACSGLAPSLSGSPLILSGGAS